MTEVGVVDGYLTTKNGIERTNVIYRATSDKRGETLSLEAEGIMISVDFADVEKIIKKARRK